MKSHIITLADFRQAPFERHAVIRCPEEHLRAELRNLVRPFKRTEAVRTLAKGDVAVLALSSELEKFNKPTVFVTVGGGLFGADFEETLVGRDTGETFETSVEGKPVAVTVKQASRTVFPEPTDEMAAAYAAEHEEFKDAKTVREYRELVRERYVREEKMDAVFGARVSMIDYTTANSEFFFDEDELAEALRKTKREVTIAEGGVHGREWTVAELSEEQVKEFFPGDALAKFEADLREQARESFAMNLWLMRVHGKDSVEELEAMEDRVFTFLDDYAREVITFTEEA